MQLAAVRALTFVVGSGAGDRFLQHWRKLSSPVREVALDWFFNHRERIASLLDAVEAGRVQPWSLGPGRTRVLERHPEANVQTRAKGLFAEAENQGRQAVYERYLPALQEEGEAGRGRQIFGEHCAQCHKVGETGFEVGPDLLAVTTRYEEVLLADILMPN